MNVNNVLSGVISGVGPQKLRVVIDAEGRGELDAPPARDMAMKCAAASGFGNGGFCDSPVIVLVGVDGKEIPEEDSLNPGLKVAGYRAEFTFANRY